MRCRTENGPDSPRTPYNRTRPQQLHRQMAENRIFRHCSNGFTYGDTGSCPVHSSPRNGENATAAEQPAKRQQSQRGLHQPISATMFHLYGQTQPVLQNREPQDCRRTGRRTLPHDALRKIRRRTEPRILRSV